MYGDRPRRPRERNAEPSPAQSQGSRPGRKFPQRWHLYQPSWARKFTIGEHEDAPVFAVVQHAGWFGRPRLTLHAGPGAESDIIASAARPHHDCHGFVIHFPRAPSDGAAARDSRGAADAVEVKSSLAQGALSRHRSYQFTVRLGRGWERWTETLEWRHTPVGGHLHVPYESRNDGRHYKKAAAAANQVRGGWQLVRLGSGMGFRPGSSGARTSGEDEVVAVWGEEPPGAHERASFAFVNSGATGELGARFADMAVVTSMALWDEEQRERRQDRGDTAG